MVAESQQVRREWVEYRGMDATMRKRYQSRRTAILEGGGKPITAGKWRNVVRCEMETKRVYRAARILAAGYLEDHCECDRPA